MEKNSLNISRAAQDVLKQLKEDIVSDKMHQGQHLVERDLADRYEVSRTMIRSALKELENEGLVSYISNKGAFVRCFTIEEICEIYETRSVLEAYASRIAVPRLSGEMVRRIEEFMNSSAVCLSRLDYQEAHRYDHDLHYIFFENCGNRHIFAMIKALWLFVLRIRWRIFRLPGRGEETIKEHKEILKALKNRDPGKIEALVRCHILNARDVLLEAVRKGLVEL
jgi:DNA-binding GntR family transcriptional regulator